MGSNSAWTTIRKKLVSAVATIVLTFGFFGIATFALAADCETYLDETTCTADVTCEWDGTLCSEIVVVPNTTLDACEDYETDESSVRSVGTTGAG